MITALIPEDEPARLQTLKEHQLLDTLPEEVYDDITRIASEICGTPIALLSLVDENRQWFKSKQGIRTNETPREYSFCAHAIIHPDEPFVVEDARYDQRFHDNPLTTGEPQVVFYAGVPVKSADGHALGTLCVIDSRPRNLSKDKLASLTALAKLDNTHFELRKSKMEMEAQKNKLEAFHLLAIPLLHELETLTNINLPEQQAHFSTLIQAVYSFKENGVV